MVQVANEIRMQDSTVLETAFKVFLTKLFAPKLIGRTTTSAPCVPPLLEIKATLGATKLSLVIDTGAAVSILPKKLLAGVTVNPTPVSLSTASGTPIKCYGQANVDLQVPCLRRSFNWNFVVADTTHPLIGIDFLSNFGLSIDCAKRSIKDSATKLSSRIFLSSVVQDVVTDLYPSIAPDVQSILGKFPDVTSPNSHSSKKVETVVYTA